MIIKLKINETRRTKTIIPRYNLPYCIVKCVNHIQSMPSNLKPINLIGITTEKYEHFGGNIFDQILKYFFVFYNYENESSNQQGNCTILNLQGTCFDTHVYNFIASYFKSFDDNSKFLIIHLGCDPKIGIFVISKNRKLITIIS